MRQLLAETGWGASEVPAVSEDRAQFRRIAGAASRRVHCTVDGQQVEAFEGDSLLTLLLLHRRHVRRFEFSNELRGGFCLIGACQDCWVRTADGRPLRACTTLVEAEMHIQTGTQDDA